MSWDQWAPSGAIRSPQASSSQVQRHAHARDRKAELGDVRVVAALVRAEGELALVTVLPSLLDDSTLWQTAGEVLAIFLGVGLMALVCAFE